MVPIKPLLLAALALCVVGCEVKPEDHCSVCRAYPAARGDHYIAGLIADSLIQGAQRSGLSSFVEIQQSRITRLAADSARCAESRQGGAINGATWDCHEPWWIIAPCGDTLWGHGCQLDSMGAGMNPDSSYEEARQLLLKCIDGYRLPCDTTHPGGAKP